jgi:hypothetical protein
VELTDFLSEMVIDSVTQLKNRPLNGRFWQFESKMIGGRDLSHYSEKTVAIEKKRRNRNELSGNGSE